MITGYDPAVGYDRYALGMSMRPVNYFINSSLSKLQKDPDRNLYYYTNGNTLLDIIVNKELWSTHISGVNDSTEISYAWNVFAQTCELVADKTKNEDNNLMDSINKLRQKDTYNRENVFIACFTEVRNDLSQWRAYGGNSSGEGGYMLSFDGPSIIKGFGSSKIWPKLIKVEYDPENQKEYMRGIAITMFSSVSKFEEICKSTLPKHEWSDVYAQSFRHIISEIAPYFKHPDFHAEKEWRVIVNLNSGNMPELKFKHRTSMISRHLPLKTSPNPLMIREILVGPSRHKAISAESLEILLRQCGYTHANLGWDVIVRTSDTPVQSP